MIMRLKFSWKPGVTMYLQNNASYYGNRLSSIILSCNFEREDGMGRAKKLVNFLKTPRTKPVSWKDVMDRKALFDESYRDEQAGDLVRDDCHVVRSLEVTGGYVFGGFDGTKFVHDPLVKVEENEDPRTNWNRPIVTVFCKHGTSSAHDCKIEVHKDSIDRVIPMQDAMKKMFLIQEVKKWKDDPSKKGKAMVDKTRKLLEE